MSRGVPALALFLTLRASTVFAQPLPELRHQDRPREASPPVGAPAPDTTSGASPLVADALPPAPATTRVPGSPEEPRSPSGAQDPDKPRFVMGGGAHVAFGAAPAVALGARLSAALASSRWAFALEGRYDLPASAYAQQGTRVRTSLAGVAVLPCVRARAIWACGVVLLSQVEGDATLSTGEPGVDGASFFLGLGGRLAAHAALPLDFALRLEVELLGHPISYELSKPGNVFFRSSALSALLGLSLVHAF